MTSYAMGRNWTICKTLEFHSRQITMPAPHHSIFLHAGCSLSSVFCCRTGSGYPNGYPVLGNSQDGCSLPSSRFVITYCDQSFPSPWHCLSAAPSLSVLPSCPLSRAFPYPQPGDAGGRHSAPAVCQSLTSAYPTLTLAHPKSTVSKCWRQLPVRGEVRSGCFYWL